MKIEKVMKIESVQEIAQHAEPDAGRAMIGRSILLWYRFIIPVQAKT